jgi:hypothetical protein
MISPEWRELLERLQGRRPHIGLSRFARYASQQRVAPGAVNDQVIDRFIAAVREDSLHRQPNALPRQVTLVWNQAAKDPGVGLQRVTVPSFRGPPKRIAWEVRRRCPGALPRQASASAYRARRHQSPRGRR